MNAGEGLTRWTVRLALACYAFTAALLLTRGRSTGVQALARLLWTLGCLAFLAHVGCAFAFFHHGSHRAAYEETARRTEELVGISWGGGLYLNYLFTAVWVVDVLWWWRGLERYRDRPRWVSVALHGFFAFLAFNGAVVFATGPLRWVALGGFAALGVLWWARRGTGSR